MSFVRTLVSRSAVKPVLAFRSLTSLAEVKFVGRISKDVELLFTNAGSPYAAYTVVVDNPSSFGRKNADGRSDSTSSFYRVTAFYPPIVQKLEQQVHDGKLGKGSLVHAIATMEQKADPQLIRTLSDGRTFAQNQFRFEHKSLDVLVPSTEYRLQREQQQAAYESSRSDSRQQVQPYDNYYPEEEESSPREQQGQAEESPNPLQEGEEITEAEVASPVVEESAVVGEGEKKTE